jgi:hypothetical protein
MMHTRTNEVTLIARWDEMPGWKTLGCIHLVKTELEKQKENEGLHMATVSMALILIYDIVTDI